MRAVIIAGGTVTDYVYIRSFIREDDCIVCADSGYDHACRLGVEPSVLVGDMDSISNIPKGIPLERYPSEKDETDTEIAIRMARKLGCSDFLLLAATGTRLDHTMANIHLLKDCADRGETACIVDEHNTVHLVNGHIAMQGTPGDLVSLLPLTDCTGVTTKNLQYPLCDAAMPVGKVMGISNVLLEEKAEVQVKSGYLTVILARD